MPCPDCNIHSFEQFGTLQDSKLFYTSPVKSKDFRESEERLKDFKIHLDTAKGAPWIWVFDCGKMGPEHKLSLSFAQGVAKILATEHEVFLHDIWIIRPNLWFGLLLKGLKLFIRSPLFNKVRLVEGSPLDIYEFLKEEGLDATARQWIVRSL
jgi:hypothetical protein